MPLSGELAAILRAWLEVHPGGPWLFCTSGVVGRSRTRSATTAHVDQKKRPKTAAGRAARVKGRAAAAAAVAPVTIHEARDHLVRTLSGSEWAVIRGWHTLRHSFISACASGGVDQRLIQEWAGHMTAEVHRRYAHLYPSVQAEAFRSVFG